MMYLLYDKLQLKFYFILSSICWLTSINLKHLYKFNLISSILHIMQSWTMVSCRHYDVTIQILVMSLPDAVNFQWSPVILWEYSLRYGITWWTANILAMYARLIQVTTPGCFTALSGTYFIDTLHMNLVRLCFWLEGAYLEVSSTHVFSHNNYNSINIDNSRHIWC